MIHPDTTVQTVNPKIGNGVFATKFIPKGTIVWTQCLLDQVIPLHKVNSLPESFRLLINKYANQDPNRDYVLAWDNGRYVNHSCETNTLSISTYVDIAIRDIKAGEQITCEYGTVNLSQTLECECGAAQCRETIQADDMLRLGTTWDDQVKSASRLILDVDQPLWPYLQDPDFVEAVAKGERKAMSHTDLYYQNSMKDHPPESNSKN